MKLTHKVAAVYPVNSSHRNGASLIVSRYKLGYVLDLKDHLGSLHDKQKLF